MEEVDFIIVGQGLAGTLLAHQLLKNDKRILVFDPGKENAATHVAAGIINPVTGRRYVKSWRIDELLPFAKKTYLELEQLLDISIYHPRQIIRTLFNAREENDWLLRTAEPGYIPYLSDSSELGEYEASTEPAYNYGEIRHSAQVNISKLSTSFGEMLSQKGMLKRDAFDFNELVFEDKLLYKGYHAKMIVFCEGSQAVNNPFFNYLPFRGAKGEVLIVKIQNAEFEKILKHRIFIVPLENDTYWIGSTYDWNYENELPTQKGAEYLTERLSEVLKLPFEIIRHVAAIRPTVKDRRPFLGVHPDFPRLGIFNGLGTKGASLGPYWAKHMTEFLLNNAPLDDEVNILRF